MPYQIGNIFNPAQRSTVFSGIFPNITISKDYSATDQETGRFTFSEQEKWYGINSYAGSDITIMSNGLSSHSKDIKGYRDGDVLTRIMAQHVGEGSSNPFDFELATRCYTLDGYARCYYDQEARRQLRLLGPAVSP